MLLVWIVAIVVRIDGILTPPQYYDMATFEAWGSHMLQVGPAHFYLNTWSDYLPLPLYSFAPIVAFSQWLGLSFGIVFKSVMSLVELILIFMIVRSWQYKGRVILLVLLALSPILIGDTAFWGQVDTIPALLTAFSMVLLMSPTDIPGNRLIYAALGFGLAVAIKPIMLITAPVLWLLSGKDGKWWQFPVISGAVFFATGIPMAGLGTAQLLWARSIDQAGTYPFTTVNAWNLWSVIPHLDRWIPDNQIVLGLNAHSVGLVLFSFLSLNVIRLWARAKWEPKAGVRVAATLLIIFYTFTTRMHERHLLFGLPLLAIASMFEFWLTIPFVLLTGTFMLNLYSAFYWVNHAQIWPFTAGLVSVVSWINVLVTLALALIWHWPTWVQKVRSLVTKNKILVGILILASLLRVVNLGYPSTYIFDEVYHAFTAREFLHNNIAAWEWWTTPPPGVAYEWTHPPVAKYGMVLGMALFGENSFGWRLGSAVAGIVSIYGLYLLTQAITKSKKIALLAAFLVSIEGLHISQSRIGMNDMYMLVFMVWSLYAAVKSRWKSAAILYGLSLASKWSAMYGIIPLSLIYLHDNLFTGINLKKVIFHLIKCIRILLISALVYVLTYTPFILAGHTWAQLLELHKQMWYYHTHLVATHAYQSIPVQWIFSARPVWYYVNYGTNTGNIYAQGNPLILWLGLVALILLLRKIVSFRYGIFYVLYLIFTVPWVFSPRIMFFYHYLPSATFLCVILAIWLGELPKKYMFYILALCFVVLLLMSPVFYGFPVPQGYWNILFGLFPSWR